MQSFQTQRTLSSAEYIIIPLVVNNTNILYKPFEYFFAISAPSALKNTICFIANTFLMRFESHNKLAKLQHPKNFIILDCHLIKPS